MRTLNTEQLLACVRWYCRHWRRARLALTEDVPGTRPEPPAGADADTPAARDAPARCRNRRGTDTHHT